MWVELKRSLFENGPFAGDVLHVHVGIGVFLALTHLLRRVKRGEIIALAGVLVLQILNETIDTINWIQASGQPNYSDTIVDSINTVLWPTVITIGSVLRRHDR